MKRIGLLSDTHGYFDDSLVSYFSACDEIWHAGDIGSFEVVDKLEAIAPLRAIHGNIDGGVLRRSFPEELRFEVEGLEVYMLHIGGYPGRYSSTLRERFKADQLRLFICGHSHILKIIYDKQYLFLHINPGAAGHHGFHIMRTAVRFAIDKGILKDVEVIELGRRGRIDID